jgi:cytosine/uracil/thiamine/allantoin permease
MPDFSSSIPSSQYLQSSASTAGPLIAFWIFYIIIAVVFVISLITGYSLLKYADTKSVALLTVAVYIIIFAIVLISGSNLLGQLS